MEENATSCGLRVMICAVLGVAMLATSCGGSDATAGPSAGDQVRNAMEAAQQVTAFRRRDTYETDGDTLKSDVRVVVGQGLVVARHQLNEARIHGVVIGDTVYLKGNSAWYRDEFGAAAKQVERVVRDNFITMAVAESPLLTLAKSETLFSQLAPFASSINTDVKISSGRTAEGVLTTVFEPMSPGPNAVRIHIAQAGDHLPMLIEAMDGSFEMVFSDWGEPVVLKPPRPSEVVTLADIASALAPK